MNLWFEKPSTFDEVNFSGNRKNVLYKSLMPVNMKFLCHLVWEYLEAFANEWKICTKITKIRLKVKFSYISYKKEIKLFRNWILSYIFINVISIKLVGDL